MAKVFLYETAPLEDIGKVLDAFGCMLETVDDSELMKKWKACDSQSTAGSPMMTSRRRPE